RSTHRGSASASAPHAPGRPDQPGGGASPLHDPGSRSGARGGRRQDRGARPPRGLAAPTRSLLPPLPAAVRPTRGSHSHYYRLAAAFPVRAVSEALLANVLLSTMPVTGHVTPFRPLAARLVE